RQRLPQVLLGLLVLTLARICQPQVAQAVQADRIALQLLSKQLDRSIELAELGERIRQRPACVRIVWRELEHALVGLNRRRVLALYAAQIAKVEVRNRVRRIETDRAVVLLVGARRSAEPREDD